MTDSFDETTRRLLREAKINGGLNDQSLFDLMVAGHNEGIKAAETLARETKEMAETLATETKVVAVTLAAALQQERRDLKAAVEKVRDDLMAYNEKLGGKLHVHIEDDRVQLARIASHLESEAGTINRVMALHCADTNAHIREPRRAGDPPNASYLQVSPDPDIVRQMEVILRERDEKRIVGLFVGRFGRALILCCMVLAIATLCLYFFSDGHTGVAEIAAIISLTVPFIVIILAYRAPGRDNGKRG